MLKKELLIPIIKTCGENPQKIKAVEELNELSMAICKSFFKNDNETKSKITEEMADVYVMLEQLKIIFNNDDEIEKIAIGKIKRTYQRFNIIEDLD